MRLPLLCCRRRAGADVPDSLCFSFPVTTWLISIGESRRIPRGKSSVGPSAAANQTRCPGDAHDPGPSSGPGERLLAFSGNGVFVSAGLTALHRTVDCRTVKTPAHFLPSQRSPRRLLGGANALSCNVLYRTLLRSVAGPVPIAISGAGDVARLARPPVCIAVAQPLETSDSSQRLLLPPLER